MKEKTSEEAFHSNSTKDLIKKGSVITIITLISRPLGYIREAIQAYIFGATLLVDSFIVAYNFPELIQTLFFSGATSAFLVPVCSRYINDTRHYSSIYATFINLSIIITIFISLIFFFLSSTIVSIIAPGFSPEAKDITRKLFVLMIPVISLHTILSVVKAFLNAKEHFAAPEVSGIVLNIVFISAAILLSKKLGIYSLAVGVSLGSALQILVQYPYLRRFKIRYSLSLDLNHPAVNETKRLFFGALIATSIVPINGFIGRIIASYLPHGEVASLSYAFRIFILPFSLFAVPVYTVAFSKISKLYHKKEWKDIFANIDSSIMLLCITLIPASIFLCSMGDICIKILYERGAFTDKDTLLTNRALLGYSIGLIFYALSISLVRIFNAFHDMKTPAIIGITSIVINALLAASLMVPFGNLGISLATSIVSFYNFSFLYILLRHRFNYRMSIKTMRDIIKSISAGIVLLILLYGLRSVPEVNIYLSLSISIMIIIIVYGVTFKNYYLSYLKKGSKHPS
ncbi:MAG TPA: murein biosynthesis integral membrane protein MurJ [Syntrophorhabdaceae bacterium]|nr:murein biosynthesis integral membrane protein MurJ [Syntrophorhabdaceae bacterium]